MGEGVDSVLVFSVDSIFSDKNISVVVMFGGIDGVDEVDGLLFGKRSAAPIEFGIVGVSDEKTIGGSVGKRHSILLC